MAVENIIVGRDRTDMERYGEKGTAFVGKHIVGEGEQAHLTNPVRVDMARPHVMLICGKRGSGKCVTGQTPVFMADGSLRPIKEIFEEVEGKGRKIIKKPDEELIEVREDVKVLSLNRKMKNETMGVSHVYRKRIKEDIIKIRTKSGREIEATKEHPLLSLESAVRWREAGDLEEGERICVLGRSKREIKESLEKSSSPVKSAVSPGNEVMEMKNLTKSDVYWDKIVEVEKRPFEGWVYDLTVPGTHNFIAGFGGVVSHNSYTGAVLAEEMVRLPEEVKNNLSVLMIDTMGIYWSMKNPNIRSKKLLEEWELKPKKFDIRLFVPKGYVEEYKEAGVKVDSTFTLPCGELSAMDWILAFGFSMVDPHGIAIERAVKKVTEKKGDRYAIDDIIERIKADERSEKKVKDALVNRFQAAKDWGIFEEEGTPIMDVFSPGTISVLDVSHYMRVSAGWSVRTMVVGLLARKVFQARLTARKTEEFEMMTGEKKKTIPMVWLIMDEAHQFIPHGGETAASEPLLTLIKEGREPGISLALITQRPNKLHEDALAQSDMVISHRLTARADIEALRSIMQTYVLEDIQTLINNLPRQKGSAIVLDDNSERLYTLQVRPRMSWHAGGSPSAIEEEGLFD